MNPEDRAPDAEVQRLVVAALEEIREGLKGGAWCLQRAIAEGWQAGRRRRRRRRKKKRRRGEEDEDEDEDEEGGDGTAGGTGEPEIRISNKHVGEEVTGGLKPISLSGTTTMSASSVANRLMRNAHAEAAQLQLLPPVGGQPYRIPPHSSFHLSTITPDSTAALSRAAFALHPTATPTAGAGQFDFILLDPPWPNRSVRRSASYKTVEDTDTDPLAALQGMLDRHIPARGLVGCWITNKAASKRQALEAFRAWNVRLVEQWVWVKTTVSGEPVTAVDGVWRKPYEMLLLGRRRGWDEDVDEVDEARRGDCVVKRVVVGVPDMHSRKPCLKELIAPMMEDRSTYRGLEIFARNLTAGYCAWGDEVLKFNWGGHWSKADVGVGMSASLHVPESGVTSTPVFLQD